ncbi:hypothetical protein K2173_016551 [Erythroxylum novogranatense]|uniref:Chaperone DnaJ-domain superfamily protein n=1 Tax=Erythroxylum novogranatense TaxID=1862640 RepID=A0AAV8SGI3_9ROSI|nr:hypothetical protein K2173_016551 [Erythroxylum novogranatense]
MATTTTATSVYFSSQKFSASLPHNQNLCWCVFGNPISSKQKQRITNVVILRSSSTSSDDNAETSSTAAQVLEESEISIEEAPAGAPSLISALNVERALRGIPITDADHYDRLGLQMGCSFQQVTDGYRNKVDELLNQQGLDKEQQNNQLELLKESFLILSSEEERRIYDWSLARSGNPDRYTWPFEVDITQTPADQSPPPQEPEDVGPTRLVGYFILGWILLSFALSIALSR